jgi:hypothetical protein
MMKFVTVALCLMTFLPSIAALTWAQVAHFVKCPRKRTRYFSFLGQVVTCCVNQVRLREFRGLAPKFLFGGLAPQNHLTMVIMIILPLSLPSASSLLLR